MAWLRRHRDRPPWENDCTWKGVWYGPGWYGFDRLGRETFTSARGAGQALMDRTTPDPEVGIFLFAPEDPMNPVLQVRWAVTKPVGTVAFATPEGREDAFGSGVVIERYKGSSR